MKPEERQAEIRAAVERDGEVSVTDLVTRYHVSGETIRRDLAQLVATGVVQKVHGGARRPSVHVENSFDERMSEQATEKAIIARKLAQVIAPGESCFIDTGTTTLACAKELAEVPDLVVITNSARIARAVARGGKTAQTFLLGGLYAADNVETVGPMVLAQIEQFQADHAIIGVAAMDAGAGALDANADEAAVARAMCARAQQVVVVAGSGKFTRRAAHRVCSYDEMDVLVTDTPPDEHFRAAIAAAGVTLC
ncbi:MAG: DeoR/GlpR transcriptional regulator [Rhodocyclaceae bacterium]|nr:DeoR/GlpR transcriptional regulator [Rhodocyclaceae bacterium]